MKTTTVDHPAASHLIRLLAFAIAALLPVSVHAQSQDSLITYVSHFVGSCGGGHDYENTQNFHDITSLTEDHTLSVTNASSVVHSSSKFGAASATAVQSGDTTGPFSDDSYCVGNGASSALAGWTMNTTVSSPAATDKVPSCAARCTPREASPSMAVPTP